MKYATESHVAIVGGGPRGTSILERLCASAPDYLPQGSRLRVHVVDPSSPGSGSVWRTDQSSELLMNTVASQVTLFTDESVTCDGPIRSGPSLYQWATSIKNAAAATSISGPDSYPSRAEYGEYLRWTFNEIVRQAPPCIEVRVHAALATRLDDEPNGRQCLTLSTGRRISGLAAVMLAQGHLPLNPDSEQQKSAKYAKSHGLRFFPPANPADLDLSVIAPGESVMLKGLGLNFFDHMALLTSGRGGRFVREADSGELVYHPSGNEPRLYAGSRRGIPYHARGDNAKGAYGRHTPVIFTEDVIASFCERVNAGQPANFFTEIWPLITKEVELVYYEALLLQLHGSVALSSFRRHFLAAPTGSAQESHLLSQCGISESQIWSWDRLQKPYEGETFSDFTEWRDWLVDYLRNDAEEAALGNVAGPLKAALDMMRDLRNELRLIIDHDGLVGASRRDHLDRWYTPLNAFLSIGPPRQRIEQMIALIEAGVLDVLGPGLKVYAEDGEWVAEARDVPGSCVRVTTLIEARLPEPDVRDTADPLLAHLLHTGQCRPHTTADGYETGGLDVTSSPYHIVNRQGLRHPRRFAVGVPTEGVRWVTAAGARPGVNSVTLADTDVIARAALHVATTETARSFVMPTTAVKSWAAIEVVEVLEV